MSIKSTAIKLTSLESYDYFNTVRQHETGNIH